jgi:hypothetical protein
MQLAAIPGNLTPRQELAALALAGGKSSKAAAEEAGCAERTIRYWQGDPLFAARVAELRTRIFDQTVGVLASMSTLALVTLGQLLKGKSETVRLGAARAILDCGARLREGVELAARLDALERLANRLAKEQEKQPCPSRAG